MVENLIGKNVFITGISGFVGHHLAKKLNDLGANVVGLARDLNSGLILDTYCSLVFGDLNDRDLLLRTLNEYNVDFVFHLAAQSQVRVANNNPISTFESNIRGTYNLMEACRLYGKCRGIIVASSDKAYGLPKFLPYTEEHPLNAKYPYDVSKACEEMIALSYHHTFNLPVTVSRCANIYGPGDMNFDRLIPGLLKEAFFNNSMSLRSDGSMKRDFLFIDDAIEAYVLLARKIKISEGRSFNFAGDTKSVLSIMSLLSKLCSESSIMKNKTIIKQTSASCHGEIPMQSLDDKLAFNVLNWRKKTKLNDGLRKTVIWYLNRFEKSR